MGLALRASGLLAALLAAPLLGVPSTSAHAATGEWRAGGALGVGLSTRSELGAAARLAVGYEVIQNLELNLSAGFAWNAPRSSGPDPNHYLLSLTPGVSYQIDVIQWIPYVGASGGYYLDVAEGRPHGVVLAPEVGVDYLVSRELRVGVQYRPSFYLGARAELPMHQLLVRFQFGSGW
jgi:hypothetical protein